MAKILVVDDSASMRQMVEFTLKEAGHQVMVAEDGQAALGLAKGSGADLVITDGSRSSHHRRQYAQHGRHYPDSGTAKPADLQIYPHPHADDRVHHREENGRQGCWRYWLDRQAVQSGKIAGDRQQSTGMTSHGYRYRAVRSDLLRREF